jgi:exopolysaccharide biosynthesis WecB/TagA/CpsF family protein
MLKVCAAAERDELPIYLYGSTPSVLGRLERSMREQFPDLKIAGIEPSKFRTLSRDEATEVSDRILASGARITFVGLGCPRQEVWAYEYRDALSMPILAVGAAFDFHAGTLSQAPRWMQDRGLEWLFRLQREPGRLWRRYLLLNPWYVGLIASQGLRLRRFSPSEVADVGTMSYG